MSEPTRVRYAIPRAWTAAINDGAHPDPAGPALSSLTETGLHLPVIDMDTPVRVLPSRRPGHSHLYLDTPMTWEHYVRLLAALADAGVIETGHFIRALDAGATFVTPRQIPRGPRPSRLRTVTSYAVLIVRGLYREYVRQQNYKK